MKVALFLTLVAAWQLVPDASAQQSTRYRQPPVQPPVRDSRQVAISREVGCLQESARGLQQVFTDHLRTRRPRPTPGEMELQEALVELSKDVDHFVKDLQSSSEMSHIYRTFHMLEYSMQEAWAVASEAGYARSLGQWLSDADGHVSNLANYGFRNPRLQPLELDSGLHSTHRGHQNDYNFSPPPPAVQPGGTMVDPGQQRPGEIRIDVGDALRRLFGSKNR